MQIKIVKDVAGFHALSADWQRLHAQSKTASIFSSWDWMSLWWQYYGTAQQLFIVVAYQGDRVVAILPTYIQRTRLLRFFSLRTLRFIGTGGDTSPDDLDALIDQNASADTAQNLITAIQQAQTQWDRLLLSDLPPTSLLRPQINAQFQTQNISEVVGARISYIPLPASWDDYLASLHRDRRQQLRNHRRRIEALDGARFFVWQGNEKLDNAINDLIALHHARWRDSGQHYAFSSPTYVDFHRAVIHQGVQANWVRLYALEIGGKTVAIYYCYRFRNQVFYFQGGFDPAWSKYGPGKILMGFAIEQSIVEGNTVFDMLRGEYEYKTQWAKERRDTFQYELLRQSVPCALYQLRHHWLPNLKHALLRRSKPVVVGEKLSDSNA